MLRFCPNQLVRQLVRQLASKRGAVLPMVALSFMALSGFVGLGIDVGRVKTAESRLANALDAAALAVSNKINSSADLKIEVERYLDLNFVSTTAGATLTWVNVEKANNNTVVKLDARAKVDTTFMRLFGINEREFAAHSEVTRENRGMELVLVLDVTGSMWGNNKYISLRNAATDLINIVFGDNSSLDNLFVGVVPYSTAVNIGPSREAWVQNLDLTRYPSSYPAAATKWKGCVEERLTPQDVSDAPPQAGNSGAQIASRFPMYFWADTVAAQDNNWISDGVISINLTNSGNGYVSAPTVTLTGGDGTGATATANLAGNGTLSSITVANPGEGYTVAPTVTFTGGNAALASGTAAISNGRLSSITVTQAGAGYTTAPTVTITGGGVQQATATATVSGGRVTSITVTNGGQGYTSAPSISFSGGGGSSAAATAIVSNGRITSINVTNQGRNYTSAPTVNVSTSAVQQAVARANISNGRVTSFTITQQGRGYTSVPTVTLTGGVVIQAFTPATATATVGSAVTLNESAGYSDSAARGPNVGCPNEVLPFTSNKQTTLDYIATLVPWNKGGTMSNIGMAWGWRMISPLWRGVGWGHQQVNGENILPLDYNSPLMDKVVVLMTDGENQFYDSIGADPFYSDYTSMLRLGLTTDGGRSDINSRDWDTSRRALNNKTAQLCTAMKAAGITIYTVTFQLGNNTAQNEARTMFRNCASKPEYYFDAESQAGGATVDLRTAFKQIGDSLANLHISR